MTLSRRKLLYWLGLAPFAPALPEAVAEPIAHGGGRGGGVTEIIYLESGVKWNVPADWQQHYISVIGTGGGAGPATGGGGNDTKGECDDS